MIKTVDDLIHHFDYEIDYSNIVFIDASSYDFDKASCEAFHVDEYINCEALKQKYSERILDNYICMYSEANCIECISHDCCFERDDDSYCSRDNIYVMFSIKN